MAFKKMTTTKALENAIKYISEQSNLSPEMERTIKMLKKMQVREKRASLRRTTRH
jgi:hypothetical protein